ncbi:MAG: AbrB/MazE/SpoVT family DNA-binding domain-containing protein [Bacilli bacterium]|nr:AbrB/MazE/SpoVT family DNA-binding domain-containing protein [Bacilli bacterium]
MKNTGVVRRIDDLGRIVIPKDIRKTLRIKDGESLEIFLSSDNIVLKKYSPLEGLQNFYKTYAESIYSEIGYNIMIVDRDKVVAASGDFKKKYLDKPISSTIDFVIQSRIVSSSKDMVKISIISEETLDASYVIAPIITNGDAVGAVIIMSSRDSIDDFVVKTGIIAAKFLGKYIEQ